MKKMMRTIGVATGLAVAAAVSTVVTGCAGDATTRSTGTYIDDTAISAKVKTELLADKGVKGTEVNVRTYDGEVQLSGFVDDSAQKRRAVEVARAVPGVKDVRDDLVVKVPVTAQAPTTTVQEPAGAQTPPPGAQPPQDR